MSNTSVNQEFFLDVLFYWLLALPFLVALTVTLYYWRKKTFLKNARSQPDIENPFEVSKGNAKDFEVSSNITVSYAPNFNSQPTLHGSRSSSYNIGCQTSDELEKETSSSPPSYVEAIKLQMSSVCPTSS